MKALSLNPPYGTLIAACERFPELGKHIETRGRWEYEYRGPLLIHQTKGLGDMFESEEELQEFCAQEPFRSTLEAMGCRDASELPRGALVAKTTLIAVESTDHVRSVKIIRHGPYEWVWTENEKAFGNYESGRRALLLSGIRQIDPPITARGMPGLWDFADLDAIDAMPPGEARVAAKLGWLIGGDS